MDGDDQAQDQALRTVLRHRSELLGFIRSMTRTTHDAEDLFQEVVTIVMRKARSPEGAEVRDYRLWAREVARRCTLRFVRERRAQGVALPSDEVVELIGDAYFAKLPSADELDERTAALRACLRDMPAHQRELLRSRFVLDREYEQIAQTTGRTAVAVRRAVARLRLALLACVQRRLARAVEAT